MDGELRNQFNFYKSRFGIPHVRHRSELLSRFHTHREHAGSRICGTFPSSRPPTRLNKTSLTFIAGNSYINYTCTRSGVVGSLATRHVHSESTKREYRARHPQAGPCWIVHDVRGRIVYKVSLHSGRARLVSEGRAEERLSKAAEVLNVLSRPFPVTPQ